MKNLRLGQITVIFMGLLLISSGCGVTVRVDDPVGAARAARDAAQRDKQEETVARDDAQRDTPEETVAREATTADDREFSEIIPPFPGSNNEFDDKIGYEEWFNFVDEETVRPIDGVIRRQFYRIPDGRSQLEVIRYYQSELQEQGAEIFFHSRDPRSLRFDDENIAHYFRQQRRDRGAGLHGSSFFGLMNEFLSAKMNIEGKDIYIVVATSRYDNIWGGPRYEVVTVVD